MAQHLLKPYCQNVLRVRVPVVVTIARKRMQIDQVLRLVPGAMIAFDQSCDAPMTVEVSDQPLASGEVVKTGDMFGIRINEILEPAERFLAVTGQQLSEVD